MAFEPYLAHANFVSKAGTQLDPLKENKNIWSMTAFSLQGQC